MNEDTLLAIGFFICLFLILLSVVLYSLIYGITPMPSSRQARKTMIGAIPSAMNGSIFELGSGWGGLAFALASHFPTCSVLAYEISPIPWACSKFLSYFKPAANLRLLRKDFFQVSFHDASLVICYLYPGAMKKLKIKFESELKPGALVISHAFAVPGWRPMRVYQLSDLYRTLIYVYKR